MLYSVALTLIDGIGPKTANALVDAFGSAQNVMCAGDASMLQAGVSERIASNIVKGRHAALARAKEIADRCASTGVAILVRGAKDYPTLLGECVDSPLVLYVRGCVNFNEGKWVSIVGTRHATQMGIKHTSTIVSDIARAYKDAVIVSGLAFGIDKAAHIAAMDNNLPTVAVMAGWVDDIVPPSHFGVAREIIRKNGAIVSDMPPGTIITGGNFLSRNRIIAGLSHCTVVVESGARGGSLVTADITIGYDRELFAVPGRLDDSEYQGTNKLIKSNKALLYQDLSDMAQAMGWNRAGADAIAAPSTLPKYLKDVFGILPDTEPVTLDFVSESLSIEISDASSRMIQLEMRGCVKSIRGRMYQKAKF